MTRLRSHLLTAVALTITLLLSLGSMCGRGTTASSVSCGIPPPNTGTSIDKACAGEILDGCPLHIPVLDGFRDPILTLENEDGELVVDVTLGPADRDADVPSIYLSLRRKSPSRDSGSRAPSFENEEVRLIEGTEVKLFGNLQSRGASWSDTCLSYSVSVIPALESAADPSSTVIEFVRAAVLLRERE